MQGWNNDAAYGQLGGMGFQDSSAGTIEPTMQELGMPVMEIFVRRDSNGNLQRQACVVREADKQGDSSGDATTALDLLSGGARASSCTRPHLYSIKITSMCYLVLCPSFSRVYQVCYCMLIKSSLANLLHAWHPVHVGKDRHVIRGAGI